jgi:hypothetical protein
MPTARCLFVATALSALCAAPAAAEDGAPARQSTLVVYGSDPCPRSTAPDEIVVCARRPETDRYRIPAPLRRRSQPPSEVSWASRIDSLDEASAHMRPDSCSAVGSFGQTGCTQSMIRQWYAARRAQRAEGAGIP